MAERRVAPESQGGETDEPELEQVLRPSCLADFVGQSRVRGHLELAIRAARARKEPLDHVLLYGPPGLGKTTLAHILAHELGGAIRVTSGPAIERPGDLAAILTNLEAGDILFIDEIHRLGRQVEEVLYPAMEDFAIDIVLGKGPSARSLRLDLPRFTLCGATTRAGALTQPLRDRFGIVERLEYYDEADLGRIVRRSARVLGVELDDAGAAEIARRGRGTARVANRLLRNLRDFAQVHGRGRIDAQVAERAFAFLEIDARGLDPSDRRLLRLMVDAYAGGPVGIATLSAASGEEATTLEDVVEPYLMQLGFLQRTTRGRVLTARAYAHLGIRPPADGAAAQGPQPRALL